MVVGFSAYAQTATREPTPLHRNTKETWGSYEYKGISIPLNPTYPCLGEMMDDITFNLPEGLRTIRKGTIVVMLDRYIERSERRPDRPFGVYCQYNGLCFPEMYIQVLNCKGKKEVVPGTYQLSVK